MTNFLENSSITNEGNFKAILKLMIRSGDTVLADHLENLAANATYISKTIQNQLINCCGKEILNTIIESANNSGFHSVIFDETTDISTNSQLSVVIRYVKKSEIREDFIGFFD